MRLRSFLFELSHRDAIEAFRKHGVDPTKLDADQLKSAYRKLAMKLHPDRGGDLEDAKTINAAYDMLKDGKSFGKTQYDAPPRQERGNYGYKPSSRETEPWAWAGYSGGVPPSSNISANDYRDVNFIKKRMWELSGKSSQEWTAWGFDGHFFRGVFSVYASPKIFDEVAKAMVFWQTKGGNPYNCRAVFVTNKSDPQKMWLIYADDKFYGDHPIEFEHDSFNSNPGNDMSFTRRLPDKLDRLKAKADAEKPVAPAPELEKPRRGIGKAKRNASA